MKNALNAKPIEEAEIEALKALIADHPLLGAIEVAEAIGVTVSNLDDVGGLPEPVQRVRASRLWISTEINEFAKVYEIRRRARQEKLRSVD